MNEERYSRQIILPGFGAEAQRQLMQASVLVIGAGGLGCPALQYLAAAGVGRIGLVDDDTISLSNLHRQILFTSADLGKMKVEVAAARLLALNPEIAIHTYPVRLNRENIFDIIRDYDFILDGTDNFESRYLINDACAVECKPLVFAAVSGYEGQLAVFNVTDKQGHRTNYRDLFPIPPGPNEIPNCAEGGVLGVLPGIIGNMAAAELIKLITNIGNPLVNKLLHYNLLTASTYAFNINPSQGYTLPKNRQEYMLVNDQLSCATPVYQEIDATQLMALQNEASTLVIDVREKHEFPGLDPQLYKQVPMSELESYLQVPISEKNIVLICQHGVRSMAAAERLMEKYGQSKKIYNLKGGIVKWRNYFTAIK